MRNIKAGGEIGRSEREEGQCSRYNSTAIIVRDDVCIQARTRVDDNTRIDGRAAVISEYDYARDGKKCDMSWKLEGTNIFGGE